MENAEEFIETRVGPDSCFVVCHVRCWGVRAWKKHGNSTRLLFWRVTARCWSAKQLLVGRVQLFVLYLPIWVTDLAASIVSMTHLCTWRASNCTVLSFHCSTPCMWQRLWSGSVELCAAPIWLKPPTCTHVLSTKYLVDSQLQV